MSDELKRIRAEKIAALGKKISQVGEEVGALRAMQREFTWAGASVKAMRCRVLLIFAKEDKLWHFQEIPNGLCLSVIC